jgi:molybdopterin converting factor small subunit
MNPSIQLRLYASLNRFSPRDGADYPIQSGISIQELAIDLHIPLDQVKLIFIDGQRETLETRLHGGERVALFPPVGGG